MGIESVFVIGAGASAEVGLPIGSGLLNAISPKLKFSKEVFNWEGGDYEILAALKSYCSNNGKNIDIYAEAGRRIHEALPLAISIDNYIDNHRGRKEVELCGKLAIVQSILEAEKSSAIYFDPQRNSSKINFKNLDNTWYLSFFQMLTENCEFNQLKTRFASITLIIFNYDRCIEHFLIHAIMQYYRVELDQAKAMVDKINIFHPYGKVGRILSPNYNENIDFGAKVRFDGLLKLAEGIRTFTESTNKDDAYLSKMHTKMETSKRLIFLGFGFHELNMQLLRLESSWVDREIFPNCFASAWEIEEDGQNIIKDRIVELFNLDVSGFLEKEINEHKNSINIRNAKCHDFFKYYLMSLRF